MKRLAFGSAVALSMFMAAPLAANVMVYDVSVTTSGSGADISYRVLDAADAVVELEVYGPLPATTVIDSEVIPSTEGLNTHSFDGTIGSSSTVSGETYGFRIKATKATGHADYTQVVDNTPATNPYLNFESPRGGVAIDLDMESDTFGMMYVANTRDTATAGGRTMAPGIYGFYPDGSNPLGFRDTPATGGVDWTTSATSSPWKIKVGPDGKLYIADWSDSHSGLWRAPLDLSGTWEEVLTNAGRDAAGLVGAVHGSVAGIYIEESGADVIVTWQDEDLVTTSAPGDGKRNIYTTTITPSTVLPVTADATLLVDENNFASHPCFDTAATGNIGLIVNDVGGGLEKDSAGNIWVSQFRSGGTDYPCLMKFDPTGATLLWDSRTGGSGAILPEADPFAQMQSGFCIDEDANKLYATSNVGFSVLDLSAALPNSNVPAAVTAVPVTGIGAFRGSIQHDAAGNIYIVSNISERAYIYSPPGANDFTFERASLTLAGGAPLSSGNWEVYK